MEAKQSIFVETFGESPLIKVLDFFLTFSSFDYSKSQIAEETCVSRVTLDKVWDELIKKNIIIKTRTIGRADMHKLNTANPRVRVLMDLDLKLSSAYADEALEKAKHKIIVKS